MVSKRDIVMGVVFGVTAALLVWWMGGAFVDAARRAEASNDPGQNLLNVVWIGLLVLALANIAAARARIRRNDSDD